MKEIKINALETQLSLCFNMAVEVAYEQITGKPFDLSNINSATDTLALIYASIVTNDPDTNITFDDLLKKANAKDIASLKTALFSAIEAWCDIPETLTNEQPEGEGDGQKNSSAPATPTNLS